MPLNMRGFYKRFFFDQDGILVDWVAKFLSMHPEFNHILEFNKHPNRVQILKDLYEEHPDFFKNLPPIKEGIEVFLLMIELGYHVEVLTSLESSPERTAEYKQHNLMKVTGLRDIEFKFTETNKGKEVHASPCSILIDDFKRNCEAFEAAGGKTVYVPREELSHKEAWQYAVKELLRYHIPIKHAKHFMQLSFMQELA